MNSKLGKLVAVHSTSPALLQRAAIVAALSFLFVLLCLVFYIVWQDFPFFVLASAFLIVQIFTMIGWWMQTRNAVNIYANGLVYRKRSIRWAEIAEVMPSGDSGLQIVPKAGDTFIIPASIQGLDRIRAFALENLGISFRP